MLVLALFWWCWVGYAWLGNVVQADEGLGRVAMFGAMAAMFVAWPSRARSRSTTCPGASSGPVVLAVALPGSCACCTSAIFGLAAEGRRAGCARQLRPVRPVGAAHGAAGDRGRSSRGRAQTLGLWIAALVVDFGGTILAGASGWRLQLGRATSPSGTG